MNLPTELSELLPVIGEEKREIVKNTILDVLKKTEQWERQLDALEVKDHEDTASMKVADVVRKNVKGYKVEINNAIKDKRKVVKDEMASFKNEDTTWLRLSQYTTAKLKTLEDAAAYKANTAQRHEEELAAIKLEKRLVECSKYSLEITEDDIEHLTDSVYDTFLGGLKVAWEKEQAELKFQEEQRLIEEEKAKLHESRKTLAIPYYDYWSDFEKTLNFGEQSESDFNNFLERIKKAKEEATKLVEAQKLENVRLQKEAEKNARLLQVEREKLAEAERLRQEEETKQRALEAQKIKEEQERLQAEKDAAEALKKTPEKDQLLAWINSFEIPATEVKTATRYIIEDKFKGFKEWALKQAEK